MKRLLLALLVLLTLAAPGFADEPDPKAVKAIEAPEEGPRLEVYYNREFFGEPWRRGDGWKDVGKQTARVAVAGVVLYVIMRWRQRSA